MLMIASRLSISMSTSGLGPKTLLGLRRVGTRARLVNAICRDKHSTSTSDLRVVAGDRPLGNADVDVARRRASSGRICFAIDELQPEVAAVAEAQLRARREHQRQLAVAGQHLAHVGAEVERRGAAPPRRPPSPRRRRASSSPRRRADAGSQIRGRRGYGRARACCEHARASRRRARRRSRGAGRRPAAPGARAP